MRKFTIIWSLSYLILAAAMFGSSFLRPCGPMTGTGLSCDFSYGMKATIDMPAEVSVGSFAPFTVAYYSDGALVPIETLNLGGFYYVVFNTTGATELYMVKAAGGIRSPTIGVDALTDYPTLHVVRTWRNVPLQVWKWYLSPVFFLCTIMSILLLMAARSSLKNNQNHAG